MNPKSTEQRPSLQSNIDDLSAMAVDAIKQYELQLTAGSEPAYPDWADKLKAVCDFAQQALDTHAEEGESHAV
jgi:hypothetical protein